LNNFSKTQTQNFWGL